MTQLDISDIHWLSPSNYPTRPDADLNVQVASEIALGASWQSVSKKYGIRHRMRDWMQWGYEAAQRDAGPEDYHAKYLDFYLKIGQALGIAEVRAQQAAYVDVPGWWLVRNPETAGEWASARDIGGTILADSVMLPAPSIAAENAAPVVQSAADIRETLVALYQSGAALPDPPTDARIVEAELREGTGTE